jgi:hypothetical protein
MISPDDRPQSTADWRKHPKSPNFFGIVIGACAFLVVAMVVAYFLLRSDTRQLIPHPNPTPNSFVQPQTWFENGNRSA